MRYDRITMESVPWPRMGLLIFPDFCQLPPWGLRVTAKEHRARDTSGKSGSRAVELDSGTSRTKSMSSLYPVLAFKT